MVQHIRRFNKGWATPATLCGAVVTDGDWSYSSAFALALGPGFGSSVALCHGCIKQFVRDQCRKEVRHV